MKILIISDNYPSNRFPNTGVFLYHLVQEMCQAGNDVTVISPQILAPRKLKLNNKGVFYGEELAKVLRPVVISFSAKKTTLGNSYQLAALQQKFWIRKLVRKHKLDYEIIYTQFISNGLIAALSFPDERNIFVDAGEYFNIDKVVDWYGEKKYFKLLHKINSFIAVSPFVKDKLLQKGIELDRILIRGNGVNYKRFYPRDKKAIRKELGLPEKDFIVSFTGHFIPSKGPVRLLQAAEKDKNTKVVFMGNGAQINQLVGDKVLFKGVVPNTKVPEYLSASDVFVLPTEHEGSNNSILEAMACGLPIISSDIPEVRIQTSERNALLVNPLDVNAISKAITHLRENEELRNSMSQESVVLANENSVKMRYEAIIKFIKEKYNS